LRESFRRFSVSTKNVRFLKRQRRKKGRISEKKPSWYGDIAMRLGVRIPPPAPIQDPIAIILPVILKLKSEGRKDTTLAPMLKRLKFLAKNVNLNHPDKVKEFIASQQYTDGYKDNLIDAYSHFCRFYSIQWTKPIYMREARANSAATC
jgi:hypothetical protein